MDKKLFNFLNSTRADLFFDDLHIGAWITEADGSVKRHQPNIVSNGLARVPIDKPLPTCRIQWISAFKELINATWAIHHHAKHRIMKRPPMDPVDLFHFAVRCFLLWNIRCRKMVDRHLIDLRSARLRVTTPPDLVSIGSISFAEYLLRLTEHRREWLFGFITHDAKSIKLPPEDRIIFEADKIVESWSTISPKWPFGDIPHITA